MTDEAQRSNTIQTGFVFPGTKPRWFLVHCSQPSSVSKCRSWLLFSISAKSEVPSEPIPTTPIGAPPLVLSVNLGLCRRLVEGFACGWMGTAKGIKKNCRKSTRDFQHHLTAHGFGCAFALVTAPPLSRGSQIGKNRPLEPGGPRRTVWSITLAPSRCRSDATQRPEAFDHRTHRSRARSAGLAAPASRPLSGN